MILSILPIFSCIRLVSLKIFISHSKQLKVDDAVEYGVKNSKFLAIARVLTYVLAGVGAFINKGIFSFANGIGLVILIFTYVMLFMVVKTLGGTQTLKLFILPSHPIIRSGLYKIAKHPNHFSSIVPELIGVLLLTHATYTTISLVPYAYFLYVRIRQEEKLMNIQKDESLSSLQSTSTSIFKVHSGILYSETFKVCRVYDHCDNRPFLLSYTSLLKRLYTLFNGEDCYCEWM